MLRLHHAWLYGCTAGAVHPVHRAPSTAKKAKRPLDSFIHMLSFGTLHDNLDRFLNLSRASHRGGFQNTKFSTWVPGGTYAKFRYRGIQDRRYGQQDLELRYEIRYLGTRSSMHGHARAGRQYHNILKFM
eukprot:SAG31_NODE_9019_length_1347_cov_1.094551_1_plen_130_part_00